MKLAFSTNAYLKHSFAEAVARLAKIGYQGVEIMADRSNPASRGRRRSSCSWK
jgi:sugar phosphate isomerase/epimerase